MFSTSASPIIWILYHVEEACMSVIRHVFSREVHAYYNKSQTVIAVFGRIVIGPLYLLFFDLVTAMASCCEVNRLEYHTLMQPEYGT